MKTSLKTTIQTFCHDLSAKTRITVLCCGCFLVLTGFLLVFLMLCPVKKENLSNHANENLMSAITTSAPTATTTAEETTTFKRTRKTTDKKRARSTTQTTVKTELIETEEPAVGAVPPAGTAEPAHRTQVSGTVRGLGHPAAGRELQLSFLCGERGVRHQPEAGHPQGDPAGGERAVRCVSLCCGQRHPAYDRPAGSKALGQVAALQGRKRICGRETYHG